MIELIEEGIDLAVRIGPIVDFRLIASRLSPNIVSAYASPEYIAKQGMPRMPDELTRHKLVRVRYHSSGQMMKWYFREDEGVTQFEPEAAITVSSPEAVLGIISHGGGIGMLPSFLATRYILSGELVPVMPEKWTIRHHITAFWAESRRGNPNVRAFSSFLKEIIPSSAPRNRPFDAPEQG